MDVSLSVYGKLQTAELRLLRLKNERALLYREIAIDVAVSIIQGLKNDIIWGVVSAESDLQTIMNFAEEVLLSFAFPQSEEQSPYASNLETLTSILGQYRPQFERFRLR